MQHITRGLQHQQQDGQWAEQRGGAREAPAAAAAAAAVSDRGAQDVVRQLRREGQGGT